MKRCFFLHSFVKSDLFFEIISLSIVQIFLKSSKIFHAILKIFESGRIFYSQLLFQKNLLFKEGET